MDSELIATVKTEYDTKLEIPQGATHYELEVDYSGCYYQGDRPDYYVKFYKEKNRA